MIEAWVGWLQRRPVALSAAVVTVLVLSAVAVWRLPISLLPRLDYPALAVWTAVPDAPPERIERTVTAAVEDAVVGTAGLLDLDSRSQLGGSLVRLRFDWNRDLDVAALDVRRALDQLASALPADAERPLVLRLDPSQRPLIVFALRTAESLDAADGSDARRLAETVVARRLEQIDGVARVRVTGGARRHLDARVDPAKLAALGLDLDQVIAALDAANVRRAGGLVRLGDYRISLEMRGELTGPDDVAQAVVSAPGRPVVRLAQIAETRWGVEERRGLVRLDGREVLLLSLEAQAGANAVTVADDAAEAVAGLLDDVPGLRLDVVIDESRFVRSAIAGVVWALGLGALLAVAVLRLFLRDRQTLTAVAFAIPLSLAMALVGFDALALGLDLITLSGLALGVGMLVDNAIVVVENIARRRDGGEADAVAARRGAAEVAPAITASTLTTLAVFLPLTQVDGLAGRLFLGQALAVTCSLLASLVVALTVVPALLSRAGAYRRTGSAAWLDAWERWLGSWLNRPAWVLGVAALALVIAAMVALGLPRQPVPDVFEPRVAVRLEWPADAGLDLIARRSAAIENAAMTWPEVVSVLADLGERDDARLDLDPRQPHRGDLTLVLRDVASAEAVLDRLDALPATADTRIEARRSNHQLHDLLVASAERGDLVIDVLGEPRDALEAEADALLTRLREAPELRNVASADATRVPVYRLRFDRDGLLRHGVSAASVATAVEATTRGRRATSLTRLDEDVPVRVSMAGSGELAALLAQRVPARDGLLPIRRFAEVERVDAAAIRARSGRVPTLRLVADLAPGQDLTAAVAAIERRLGALPAGLRVAIRGANEAFADAVHATGWSLALSLVLVYLILATQFESLVQPLVVLAVVPLAIGGVAVSLAVSGHGWNLMSLTGCVVLIGIAVNDAIVKVDFANRARQAGADSLTAARRAGRDRLRPVLMTTWTTALGLLPLALGWGPGADLRAPFAIAIIGGLVIATLLTLVVVPTLYSRLVPDGPAIDRSTEPAP